MEWGDRMHGMGWGMGWDGGKEDRGGKKGESGEIVRVTLKIPHQRNTYNICVVFPLFNHIKGYSEWFSTTLSSFRENCGGGDIVCLFSSL